MTSLHFHIPEIHTARRVLPVLLVGLLGGIIGFLYLGALHILQGWVGPEDGNTTLAVQTILLVGTGFIIAGVTKWLGTGGDVELLVDNIHVLGGARPGKADRQLVPISLLGIAVGSTLGPEAPLVQTCGTMGSAVARKLGLDQPDIRVLTLVGMAAGFTVLFGTPVGATIFALELLHRRGLEYYEAIVPALVGGLIGYGVFVFASNIGVRPVWDFSGVGSIRPEDLGAALIAGLAGAAIGAIFAWVVNIMRTATEKVPVWVMPVLGGIGMAALGIWSPFALTFGEHQLAELVVPGLAASALLIAFSAKLLGAAACLVGRWKGGFIIPLFFCGAAVGQLLSNTFGWSSDTVFITATMAAAVTSVLKTPLGSPLVVSGMSGLSMLPTALVASVVSLALTSRVNVITSQRHRTRDDQAAGRTTTDRSKGGSDGGPGVAA